jgi:hypothetical protein
MFIPPIHMPAEDETVLIHKNETIKKNYISLIYYLIQINHKNKIKIILMKTKQTLLIEQL